MSVEKFRRPIASPFGEQSKLTVITSAQLLAMNATPISIVPAPKTGFANVLIGIMAHKPAGTAYNLTTATGLSVKYTNGSGLEVSQAALTGFLDQTTVQSRWMKPHAAASGANTTLIVAAAALVMQILTAEITTGTGGLRVRAFYRTVPTVP